MSSLKFIRVAATLAALLAVATGSTAATPTCGSLIKGSHPQAVLLDPEGHIAKGPIDLGDLPFDADFERENYKIPTHYKVLIWPARMSVDNEVLDGEYVQLKPIPEECSGTSTYEVALFINFNKGDARPAKLAVKLPNLAISDSPSVPERDATSAYRFDARVLATIVQPVK